MLKNLEHTKELSADTIFQIESNYGIKLIDRKQLYSGADQNTFVYKTKTAEKKTLFLKIRTGYFNESSVTVPYMLSQKTILAGWRCRDGV